MRHSNFIKELMIIGGLCAIPGSPLAAQGERDEWVVRELFPPIEQSPPNFFQWDRPYRLGDVDRDSHPDLLFNGLTFINPQGSFRQRFDVTRGGHFATLFEHDRLPFISTESLSVPVIILRRPSGYVAAFQRYRDIGPHLLELRELPGGRFLGNVPLPKAPDPSLPDPYRWARMQPAGDVNGDGFDDLFSQSRVLQQGVPFGIQILLDGATFQPMWMTYLEGVRVYHSFTSMGPEPYDDVNGDGYRDMVAYLEFRHPVNGSISRWWYAFSGQDGSVLWRTEDPITDGNPLRYTERIPDVDGDGVEDLLILQSHREVAPFHPGALRALSGRDGSLIWLNQVGLLVPWYGNVQADHAVGLSLYLGPVGDWDRDGVPDVLVVALEARIAHVTETYERRIWIFSGADGTFLDRVRISGTLAPWYPGDGLRGLQLPGLITVLGDIDGDGWTEIAVDSHAGSFPPGHYHMVILGKRTLIVPEDTRRGGRLNFGLDMPGAAGRPFHILVSPEFAPHDGLHLGPWNTHLGITRWTQRSKRTTALSGVLDAQGQAVLRNRLASNSALGGRTLYSVAVVQDPQRPGGVFTLSSLGVTEIR